jgi:hypothetical protein
MPGTNDQDTRSGMSVAQFAQKWKIGEDKVRHFISTGELKAYNFSTSPLQRPQFRIPVEAEAEFLQRRRSGPPPRPAKRRKNLHQVHEYYPD